MPEQIKTERYRSFCISTFGIGAAYLASWKAGLGPRIRLKQPASTAEAATRIAKCLIDSMYSNQAEEILQTLRADGTVDRQMRCA